LQAFDSDSEVEQLPAAPHPSSSLVDKVSEKVAPIPAVAGRIHSVDTFSAVDGPGLRMVVFEQVRGSFEIAQGLSLFLEIQHFRMFHGDTPFLLGPIHSCVV
jgi:hypothetical protein